MDDLEKYVKEREQREAGFAQLVIDAEARQAFARKLAEKRRSAGKTQTQVAAMMRTSASIVGRLEAGSDVRVSTLEKYVAAIGMRLDFRAVPRPRTSQTSKRAATKRPRKARAARRVAGKGAKKSSR